MYYVLSLRQSNVSLYKLLCDWYAFNIDFKENFLSTACTIQVVFIIIKIEIYKQVKTELVNDYLCFHGIMKNMDFTDELDPGLGSELWT